MAVPKQDFLTAKLRLSAGLLYVFLFTSLIGHFLVRTMNFHVSIWITNELFNQRGTLGYIKGDTMDPYESGYKGSLNS